jgi:hypothetical protein
MLVVLCVAEEPTRQSWLFPQWYMLRPAAEAARRYAAARLSAPTIRDWAIIIAGLALLMAAANIPLPASKTAESSARGWLVGGVIGIWIVFYLVRDAARRMDDRRFLRSSARHGELDGLLLLERIKHASGDAARLEKVIGRLAKMPRASRSGANEALSDLVRALTHVERMVPAKTKTRIPRGVWDVGPVFALHDFRQWVEDFDAAHPGRLSWMAAKHSDTLSRLVDSGPPPSP